ncbi:hypothetical protein L873DRAFT_1360971 [Choiromyces venosus 120613-1]|uniref:Uncharacterized protein n=1 Tax=Choiromyces venosus 120613-1 TaxID=1336337 RepID=A0A3N4K1M1_9PEZI|nr:hypothetical protein L873DRAFT_1360971 [Choiromyces venosus 120613-1]
MIVQWFPTITWSYYHGGRYQLTTPCFRESILTGGAMCYYRYYSKLEHVQRYSTIVLYILLARIVPLAGCKGSKLGMMAWRLLGEGESFSQTFTSLYPLPAEHPSLVKYTKLWCYTSRIEETSTLTGSDRPVA